MAKQFIGFMLMLFGAMGGESTSLIVPLALIAAGVALIAKGTIKE